MARRLAGPAWDAVGWVPKAGESERTSIARSRILMALADTGRDEDLVAEARRRFGAHLADPTGDDLAPDLIRTVAQIAVAAGPEGWSETLEAYRRTDNALEQLRYLYALADTRDPELRIRTLDMMLGSEVRSQDAPFVIGVVMSQPGAAPAVWDWVETNWPTMAERFPPSRSPSRILDATAAVADAAPWLQRIRRFCADIDIPISTIRMEQILERMDVNVARPQRPRGTRAAGLGLTPAATRPAEGSVRVGLVGPGGGRGPPDPGRQAGRDAEPRPPDPARMRHSPQLPGRRSRRRALTLYSFCNFVSFRQFY